ncbi:DUF2853 family protein [Leucothrix arctica]|uniref:DUF2853 domain-containing protein n=1 Tax=Leucothrix arctica TaxID=1481894 RepID=A0A317CME7_9GAMM|nr:DUF2853 family protein [Leucothrix arctica]PWQ99714.1 DUF2853 domain-containing protein [Leucothrix arctica]
MADVIEAIEDIQKYDKKYDEQLVTSIFRSLGPVVYNKDTRYIACSDAYELEMVRDGFLKRQLGIKDSDEEIEQVMSDICELMSNSEYKLRVTFYYLLVIHYKKQAQF